MPSTIFRFAEAKKPEDPKADSKQFRESLSALAFAADGRVAFLAGDETVEITPSIERLLRQPDGVYAHHISLPISDFLTLPDTDEEDGRQGEIDIEGISIDDGWLWLTGSFSCNRKKPKREDPFAEQLKTIGHVRVGKNRFFLGRIPLDPSAEGGSSLAKKVGEREAGRVKMMEAKGAFIQALEVDEHFSPFLRTFDNDKLKKVRLPGKDNGLDVEGLLVRGNRVFLGLRGPVLRGYACILELAVQQAEPSGGLELIPLKVDAGTQTRLYRKHFVRLDGLGIRDLEEVDGNLLILAGPTGDVHGPEQVYRWRAWRSQIAEHDTITDLKSDGSGWPVPVQSDSTVGHPEAIALWPFSPSDSRQVMVMRDSPGAAPSGEPFSAVGELTNLPA